MLVFRSCARALQASGAYTHSDMLTLSLQSAPLLRHLFIWSVLSLRTHLRHLFQILLAHSEPDMHLVTIGLQLHIIQ